ncbi:M23 family metallopeptidase [Aliikangiella coralliicola]|uniref:Peptidoglycan DD-metalloendopeptidase family protein n=1 Tax=Aliikangiella coralliicola TaxID=2592383 RepID=A0A545UJ11_9GAMM|nr:M23 family metallopeptidase [Aliikangiella coralliicola]TQV89450.1 peptidoglycan DD-metalloendopeptidase family protein [Aliikangiella coralliicola]
MNLIILVNLLSGLYSSNIQNSHLVFSTDSHETELCAKRHFSSKSDATFWSTVESIKHHRLQLKPKQTLTQLLSSFGVDEREVYQISKSMTPYLQPAKLQVGQSFEILLSENRILSLSMNFDFDKKLNLARKNNQWQASVERLATISVQSATQGRVESSLYESFLQAEIPLSIFHQYVSLMSHFVDFQRDLKAKDYFALVYSTQSLQSNPGAIKAGFIEYAEIKVRNETVRLYRYEIDGEANYYDESGYLVGSFLIKTPVKGGVLSSHYGKRKHPVLGYTRMHKGLDFGAPLGTPIIAAGKGKVIQAGWSNSFGNFVKIQHLHGYQTLYAHMKKIRRGIKKGVRLRQGEVIGFLGSTGLTAGRHLHYEIHKNGKAINPISVKQKHQVSLNKHQLKEFKEYIRSIQQFNIAP